MKFITIYDKRPNDGEWYLVKCPGYCPSGFSTAQWNSFEDYWSDEGESSDINERVTEYLPIPLNELHEMFKPSFG